MLRDQPFCWFLASSLEGKMNLWWDGLLWFLCPSHQQSLLNLLSTFYVRILLLLFSWHSNRIIILISQLRNQRKSECLYDTQLLGGPIVIWHPAKNTWDIVSACWENAHPVRKPVAIINSIFCFILFEVKTVCHLEEFREEDIGMGIQQEMSLEKD